MPQFQNTYGTGSYGTVHELGYEALDPDLVRPLGFLPDRLRGDQCDLGFGWYA